MKLICNIHVALHIASIPGFYERTKHIEVDYHFIKKILSRCVAANFINSNDQLANIFMETLKDPRIKYICSRFGAYGLYATA